MCGVAVVATWDKITRWLTELVSKLASAWKEIRSSLPHGAQIVGDIVVEGLQRLAEIMHRLYIKKEDGKWIERTTIRQLNEAEVPLAIRNKLSAGKETDITEEIQKELQLEV